jgi:hypothetical protein
MSFSTFFLMERKYFLTGPQDNSVRAIEKNYLKKFPKNLILKRSLIPGPDRDLQIEKMLNPDSDPH